MALISACANISAHVQGIDSADTSWNQFFYSDEQKNVLICSLGQTNSLEVRKPKGTAVPLKRFDCEVFEAVQYADARVPSVRPFTVHFVAILSDETVTKEMGKFITITRAELDNANRKVVEIGDDPKDVFACNADIRSLAIDRGAEKPIFGISATNNNFNQLRFGNCTHLTDATEITVEARTSGFTQLVLFYALTN